MRGSNCSFPATAEWIMVMPKAVARTTAPNNQKSKYRHERSRSNIVDGPQRQARTQTRAKSKRMLPAHLPLVSSAPWAYTLIHWTYLDFFVRRRGALLMGI